MDERPEGLPRSGVGVLVRQRRQALRLTLQGLADRVGCAKSYLSEIENGRRLRPPGDDLLRKLEDALGYDEGTLVDAAAWSSAPAALRTEIDRARKAATRLKALVRSSQGQAGALDSAYHSGELVRLLEQLGGDSGDASGGSSGGDESAGLGSGLGSGAGSAKGSGPDIGDGGGSIASVNLPTEVPLINRVSAGYPSEFTDLGYPARVADEYVRVPELRDADAFAARVVGDSMMPEYREGDVVVFSPARELRDGMDCFARLEPDHESTFKRVYFEDEGSKVRLQPLNSSYAPRVVNREELAGLYAAVTVMRSL